MSENNEINDNNKEISICKKCGRVLKSKKSIERGYGPTCFRWIQQRGVQNGGVVDPGIRGEIDFLKCEIKMLKRLIRQVKSNNVQNSSLDPIERIKREEHRPERNENKMVMGDVIRELKSLFENGNFKDLLKTIPTNELLGTKTLMECEI